MERGRKGGERIEDVIYNSPLLTTKLVNWASEVGASVREGVSSSGWPATRVLL